MSMTTQEREALQDCVGALQFILAFYEPGQRYLDTEAWKRACASGVRAYMNAASLIDWTIRPMEAVNGEVHFTAQVGRNPEGRDAQRLGAKHEHAVGAEGADAPNPSVPSSSDPETVHE